MRTTKPLLTLLSATVISLMALGPNSSAGADTRVITGNDKGLSVSSFDSSRGLELIVTKTVPFPPPEHQDGKLPYGGVAGVIFTLQRATNIDVSTDEGRADAARQRSAEELAALELEVIASGVTNNKGEVLFSGLQPGLYRLEDSAPDEKHDYQLSGPVWLVLPLGDVTGNGFVHHNVIVVKPTGSQSPTTPPVSPPAPSTPPAPTQPPALGTEIQPSVLPQATPATTAPQGPVLSRQPDTGANVLAAAVTGLGLIVLGWLMLKRRRKNDT